jgi:hypothetical protein
VLVSEALVPKLNPHLNAHFHLASEVRILDHLQDLLAAWHDHVSGARAGEISEVAWTGMLGLPVVPAPEPAPARWMSQDRVADRRQAHGKTAARIRTSLEDFEARERWSFFRDGIEEARRRNPRLISTAPWPRRGVPTAPRQVPDSRPKLCLRETTIDPPQ